MIRGVMPVMERRRATCTASTRRRVRSGRSARPFGTTRRRAGSGGA